MKVIRHKICNDIMNHYGGLGRWLWENNREFYREHIAHLYSTHIDRPWTWEPTRLPRTKYDWLFIHRLEDISRSFLYKLCLNKFYTKEDQQNQLLGDGDYFWFRGR